MTFATGLTSAPGVEWSDGLPKGSASLPRQHPSISTSFNESSAAHRKELALRALREHEAKEEARRVSALAEEILAIRGLTHFDERDWR